MSLPKTENYYQKHLPSKENVWLKQRLKKDPKKEGSAIDNLAGTGGNYQKTGHSVRIRMAISFTIYCYQFIHYIVHSHVHELFLYQHLWRYLLSRIQVNAQ
jgi:hypothetical protein